MLHKITEKELAMQDALGSLPEEYRNNLCRKKTPEIAKSARTCTLCGLKCIHKGEEFYDIGIRHWNGKITFNVCKSCSWLTIQTINKIINEHNNPNKGD